MRATFTLLAAAIFLSAGCSSDATTSDEDQIPAQQLAAPNHVAVLIDDWYAANERGDGSVVDLYLPNGYHLYGDNRIELNDLTAHLSGGSFEHEWITDLILIVDEGDGRYVVARGMRNTGSGESSASSLTFEVVTTADGSLLLAQSAWLYEN